MFGLLHTVVSDGGRRHVWLYTYIHTYTDTDRQTDRPTDTHTHNDISVMAAGATCRAPEVSHMRAVPRAPRVPGAQVHAAHVRHASRHLGYQTPMHDTSVTRHLCVPGAQVHAAHVRLEHDGGVWRQAVGPCSVG